MKTTPALVAALVAALALTGAGAAIAQTPAAQPAATAAAPAPDAGKPATIPFVRFGQIYDFEADPKGNGVYLQDRSKKWYYASVFGPCTQLPFAQAIGVKTRGLDQLDNTGSIIVDGDECKIDKLVESAGPPNRQKKPKH